ncbi:MAG TPA: NCS2 family permease [Actinospica sp.]|jgi:AGZA family xanthine/uracil permease-like MFS transporter|nr:NCS2 family permease [Actinospica sp.]
MTQVQEPTAVSPDIDVRTAGRLERYFHLEARGSNVSREIRGGLTTFFAMAYIVLLNPIIIGSAADVTGAHLSIGELTTSTAFAAAVTTLLMGLVGNAPLALAAGLGTSGVVVSQIAPHMTWPQAMGLMVLEGVVIVLLVVTGLRETIMNAIPLPLKHAIGVGIGAFVALIGLVDSGVITRQPDAANTTVPVQLGTGGHLAGWPAFVFCFGLLLMIALTARRIPGAILIGIVASTMLAVVLEKLAKVPDASWGLVIPKMPHSYFAAPEFGLFGHVDLFGGFAKAGPATALIALFTLVLSGFFDAMGTIMGVTSEAGLTDADGRLPGISRILLVDGVGAVVGGGSGASANTVFVESTAGVGEGARTGIASIVTGLLFAAALLFTPIAEIVPAQATTPALVLIGALMMGQIRHVDFTDFEIAVPAFLTIVLMPFTYSITDGVGAGLIAYTVIKVALGKWREPGWFIWGVTAVFLVFFGIDGIQHTL